MNRYTLLTLLSLLLLVAVLPLYAWWEPQRMEQAQADLRQEFVSEAAVMYVENCAVCHGAAGEGIGPTPGLDNDGLRGADYDTLFKTIARGRYGTAMAGWHVDEGGIYTEYEIGELVALIRYVDWSQVRELAAEQGLIPPTLPVPEVDEALLAQVAALDAAGSAWSAGLQLYATNCTVCHGINGEGTDLGVALNTPDVRALDTAVLTRTISEGIPGTMMAGWGSTLTAEAVNALAQFLQNWDKLDEAGVALTPPEPVQIDLNDPEAVQALGERIFTTTCTSCHGENGSGGTGPALNSQQVLGSRTDQQLYEAIVSGGRRPNSTMPAFGDRLTSVEIEALVSYLRAWEPTAPWVENPRGTAQGGGPPWLRATPDPNNPVEPGAAGGQGNGRGQGIGQGGPPWRDTGTSPGGGGPESGASAGAQPDTQAQGPTLHFTGEVVDIQGNQLTFRAADGSQHDAMLGPPWFWENSGIPLQPGDQIELEGFESPDHMELNWLTNHTTGQTIQLRTVDGVPVWSGG